MEDTKTLLQPDLVVTQEQDQLVQQVMRLMLFRQQKQPDVPIRQSELASVINAAYKDQRKSKLSSVIIAQAQLKFIQMLGLEMKKFTLKTARAGAAKGSEGILSSSLPTLCNISASGITLNRV